MRRFLLLLLVTFFPTVASAQPIPTTSAGEASVRRSAWEQIPPGFIGNWKLDPAASKYDTTAPRMQYRIFDYTADGKFICTYITLSARNSFASGNWAVQLDGSPGVEYTRAYGSTPYAIVTLKKQDENNLYLTAARAGKIFEEGTFTLSPDGNTLTFAYHQGDRKNTAIYHRWNMLD